MFRRPKSGSVCFRLALDPAPADPSPITGASWYVNRPYPALLIYKALRVVDTPIYICKYIPFANIGSSGKYQIELKTFGIPTQILPFASPTIDLSSELHSRWVRFQQPKLTSSSAADDSEPRLLVVVPGRFDVLFGRGTKTAQHTGNLRAVHLVEMHRPQYEAADKFGKTILAERIVTIIQESGGRFLKRRNDLWVEVDEIMAREKISHFFRKLRSIAPAASASNKLSSESIVVAPSSQLPMLTVPLEDEFAASLVHLHYS